VSEFDVNTLLVFGTLIGAGYLLGELAHKLRLPRVSGYIVAGLILNPEVSGFVSKSFLDSTASVTSLSLAVLTFAVGGTLALAPLKELGKGVLFIAIGEAELAALLVVAGCCLVLPLFIDVNGSYLTAVVPLALLLGSLASPTDPSATLAVIHQYKARGLVSFSIMAAAALDDAFGIINFSIATVVASMLITHTGGSVGVLLEPFIAIFGSIAVGAAAGFGFHYIPRLLRSDSDGLLVVVLFGLLALCYGVSTLLNLDQLLATMSMGIVVVNFGVNRDRIFRLLEEVVEPLIFVIFFTISGMLLDFVVLWTYLPLVLFFVLFRSVGKLTGAYLGARLGGAPLNVRRYAGWGLIPQGGIVIGLALILNQNPAFSDFSTILLSVIIGATVLHELVGPLTAKLAIQKSGEINLAPEAERRPGASSSR
jgi:Kef-type K+ transport system membrane component KefB